MGWTARIPAPGLLAASLVSLVFLFSQASAASTKSDEGVTVCYVGSWAAYRPGRGAFSVEDLRPDLCSHIVYTFAGLNVTSWSIVSLDPHLDLQDNYGKGWYKKTTGLRKDWPDLKVTIAIGGWNEGSANYSVLAADPQKRKLFLSSVLRFLKEHEFDGLDLDWEFPTQRGGRPEDKENFITLIKELRAGLKPHGYLLTAAISASPDTLAVGYDLPRLSEYLDLVHMMAYDYHGNWETKTGANAPLFPSSDKLTLGGSLEYVLKNGLRADKLVVGVPMYGRTFVLATPESSGVLGEEALPAGSPYDFQGPFTRTAGFLGYNEICNNFAAENWTIHWDNTSMTPFATSGRRVITYDNPESIRRKVEYAMGEGVAGMMTWSVDTDDFRGDCGSPGQPSARHPLLQAIHQAVKESRKARPTSSRPPPAPASAPLTAASLLLAVLSLLISFSSH